MNQIIGIYIRVPADEIARLKDHPEILPKYDPRVALQDGRGLDLGRAWEELGCFLDGGIKVPEHGPTVGDIHLPHTDSRATWSYVEPERVSIIARELGRIDQAEFDNMYEVDGEETMDTLPTHPTRTAAWGDRAAYLFNKLCALADHYQTAADNAEAMLVRIGDRV